VRKFSEKRMAPAWNLLITGVPLDVGEVVDTKAKTSYCRNVLGFFLVVDFFIVGFFLEDELYVA
jgi:hypothetical protein